MAWHPEDIKAAVRKKGITLTALAVRNGLQASACRVALCRCHYDGEQAIARWLGVPASKLWPGRYYADGTPKSHRIQRRQNAAASPESHGKKERAA